MVKTIFVLSFSLLCFIGCQSPKPSETEKDVDLLINASVKARIDSTLKSFVDSGKVAGVSALIFEKNKETYFNAFGFADIEAKVPMDRNTIVRIFSMTKPVTG